MLYSTELSQETLQLDKLTGRPHHFPPASRFSHKPQPLRSYTDCHIATLLARSKGERHSSSFILQGNAKIQDAITSTSKSLALCTTIISHTMHRWTYVPPIVETKPCTCGQDIKLSYHPKPGLITTVIYIIT